MWWNPPKRVKQSNEIFVFGSNLEGRHGKGAAREALMEHGAVWGQAEGKQGNSYAIPTKRTPYKGMTLEDIAKGIKKFLRYAKLHPELTFRVTAIGTGLAGWEMKDIAPLFKKAPSNCILPDEWVIFNHENKDEEAAKG